MFAIGLFASWLGTLCWNEASQRLPTDAGRPADRLRDAVGAGLRLRAARRSAACARDRCVGVALLIAGVMLGAARREPRWCAASARGVCWQQRTGGRSCTVHWWPRARRGIDLARSARDFADHRCTARSPAEHGPGLAQQGSGRPRHVATNCCQPRRGRSPASVLGACFAVAVIVSSAPA
ncbi:MAG: hypothetical protein MZW92_19665 [Comamonadaceae bacterium]|nr:hypothetical protein [Comamonadaceae bacterium]